jgi:hypothetical protein
MRAVWDDLRSLPPFVIHELALRYIAALGTHYRSAGSRPSLAITLASYAL